jgi:hypothetical protein
MQTLGKPSTDLEKDADSGHNDSLSIQQVVRTPVPSIIVKDVALEREDFPKFDDMKASRIALILLRWGICRTLPT